MFTCRSIVEGLQADFAERGQDIKVTYGAWTQAQHDRADRVVLSFGKGSLDFTGINADGWGVDRPQPNPAGGAPVEAATTMAMHMQKMVISCHGVAPAGTPDNLKIVAGVDRANEIMHLAVAALKRHLSFTSMTLGALEWPNIDKAAATHGAAVTFECAVMIPVLGDRRPIVQKPKSATIAMKAKPDGEAAEQGAVVAVTVA